MQKKLTFILILTSLLCSSCLFAQSKTDSIGWTMKHQKNIVWVSPMKALDMGWGFGLSYERLIGKNKDLGLIFPLSYVLGNRYTDYNDNTLFQYFYFTPGFKFYPLGHKRVTYAIGSNLLIGYGGKEIYREKSHIPYEYPITNNFNHRQLMLGIMVRNYVSFKMTPKFGYGLSLGFGDDYIKHYNSYENYEFHFVFNFSLDFEYRF